MTAPDRRLEPLAGGPRQRQDARVGLFSRKPRWRMLDNLASDGPTDVPIAGVSYREEALRHVGEGTFRLYLRHDPANAADPRAVQVIGPENLQLGFLPWGMAFRYHAVLRDLERRWALVTVPGRIFMHPMTPYGRVDLPSVKQLRDVLGRLR